MYLMSLGKFPKVIMNRLTFSNLEKLKWQKPDATLRKLSQGSEKVS